MSYFQASETGARHFDFNVSTVVYAATPLIHDIAAAQRIYGADMTTRTGDTLYGFNSNAGRDSYDFTKTPAPVMAIWDAGGIDTIDASGYATDQIIDLSPGALSSIGGVTFHTAPSFEEVNANRAAQGFPPVSQATYDANMAALKANPAVGRLTDNVGIAYGAIIENAIGGSGNDSLLGNSYNNVLTGNAGHDILGGGAGNDTLLGGSGNDTLLGGDGDDLIIAEINLSTVSTKRGDLSIHLILDFDASGNDVIDLSRIDADLTVDGIQAFEFAGKSDPKSGEISWKSFGNINAAEAALGFDIDGIDGPAADGGPVTIIFGNNDGDADADFAMVLLGTQTIDATDFIFG